MFFSVNLVGP